MNQEAKEVKEVSLMEKEAAPSMLSVEETRATQEVRAQMVIAKEFPRDEIKSRNLIKKACERESLAELAQYVYPRGNTQVT